ncbi:hypothetical protein [Sphingomonas sp. Leaf339]|uniref:hypothetical protein n=1 Tax=Sphingomonas sp. Leaf339 TaxID=1736343 RepID=UPI0012E3CA5A|nr:hypothetical protein [Sphingomonas sp. Leaf339]
MLTPKIRIIALSAICCTSGCATLYDARRDTNATAVAKAFDDAAPGPYFEKMRESYREAAAREEATVVSLKRTERDSEVINAVAPVRIGEDEQAVMGGEATPVGTAPFTSAVTNQIGALVSGCASSCPSPSAMDLIRWRAVAGQRVILARVAKDQVDAPLREFVGSRGRIGELMRRVAADVAEQKGAEAQAKAMKVEIAALDAKAEALPRAQFLADVAKLQKELSALDLPAAAKVAGFEELGSKLDDLLAVELDAAVTEAKAGEADAKDPSKTTKRAQAVLELLGATEQLVLAYRDLPAADRASALLIAKAAAQQQFDVAKLNATLAGDLLQVHRQELSARSTELSRLAEAGLALRSVRGQSAKGVVALGRPDRIWYTRALVQYGVATSNGRLVFDRLDRREAQLQMAYRIDLADRTATNRRALIAPAIEQIKAAGSAGIKPELIANLAGQLGVTTSILVN